ncbi:hypothetical protein CHS0354_004882 [Potamilus streckersoni]|uniref:Amine oxidase n=1 Tax=Potamilus streckersoni TaxID=2493646 RepID=A0AAE0W101_9BIVA|nr:hypothetical protein CHS0354_004882 [Potamilus streckersoni]
MVTETSKKTALADRMKTVCCCQILGAVIFAIGLAVGIVIGLFVNHGQNRIFQSHNIVSMERQVSQCPTRNPIIHLDYESSIFAPLTIREMIQVAQILLKQSIILSLNEPTRLTQNFITSMYLHPPTKAIALAYLDNGGPSVGRYAKVHVQRGSASPPDIMEYKVGPLGDNKANITQLTKEGDIHFNSRPYEKVEITNLKNAIAKDMNILAPLIAESFDGAMYPRDLTAFFFNGAAGFRAEERDTRFVIGFWGFKNKVDLFHLLPLSGTIHSPGTDTSRWYTHMFYYLNQGPYRNASELMESYRHNKIRKIKLPDGYRDTTRDRIFPKRDERKPLRNFSHRPGSRSYEPDGARYTVAGSKIRWMGWEFDISAGQMRGVSLFDIRFKRERIIYELSSSETVVTYANDDSAQNGIIYTDASFGLLSGHPIMILRDVDCPQYATILNTTYWSSATQKPGQYQSICIFEADGQEPLWRHNDYSFAAGLRNRYLVVRVPTAVGNYDYIFEYHFYLDGKLYTTVSATGYIHTTFWDVQSPHMGSDKTKTPFGYRVSDYSMGAIHDHTFGFKVDMDVISMSNTFKVIKWRAGNILDAFRTQVNIQEQPPYFAYNQTRYIEWETLQQEREMQLSYDDQTFWIVVNDKEKNKWGVERGYQIAPLKTAAQTLTEAHPAMRALSFTKYHCAVTKRKEDEQHLTSTYDINRLENPKGHLDLMLDNESIIDQDLVTWVTVGFLHVPTSEDVPMTTKVATGFLLKPFNFFDNTASFDMPEYYESADHKDYTHEPEAEACHEAKYRKFCKYC